MRGSSFGYLIKEGAKSVYANRLMSFASIGTLVACMAQEAMIRVPQEDLR